MQHTVEVTTTSEETTYTYIQYRNPIGCRPGERVSAVASSLPSYPVKT